MTTTSEKTQPAAPLSPTDLLKASVAEEIAELQEALQAARQREDVQGIALLSGALADIKLQVAATALRVEANLRRMLAGAPGEMTEKALGALAKLRGAPRPGPDAGDAQ